MCVIYIYIYINAHMSMYIYIYICIYTRVYVSYYVTGASFGQKIRKLLCAKVYDICYTTPGLHYKIPDFSDPAPGKS